jgi:hypothetical protein
LQELWWYEGKNLVVLHVVFQGLFEFGVEVAVLATPGTDEELDDALPVFLRQRVIELGEASVERLEQPV